MVQSKLHQLKQGNVQLKNFTAMVKILGADYMSRAGSVEGLALSAEMAD